MDIFNKTEGLSEREPIRQPAHSDNIWVDLAYQAFEGSTNYFEASLYRTWERNISLFRGEHPDGSKYRSDQYKHRSRIFRPKTRATIRRNEAAAALAFFATDDAVSIEAEDDSDPQARLAASIRKELINYRLTTKKNAINWFLTTIGAFQDTMVMGACCSYQYWEYEETEEVVQEPALDDNGNPVLDGETGEPWVDEIRQRKVKHDRPRVELIPLENIRFDPAASWVDPINSSPYVIELMPMYVCDVKERMRRPDPKTGEPQWFELSDRDIIASRRDRYDSVRQTREGRERRDPKDDTVSRVKDYEIVWVHRNIIRRDGEDWVYYTLGTTSLLSEPKTIDKVYLHGLRPYVIGYSVLETHRTPPGALVELAEGLQVAANDLVNQRFDNVRLVLNKRYFGRRESNIDMRSLLRNVPGSVTLMDDPNEGGDVRIVDTPDVTRSSYEEQDRLNVDFDEVMGTFSQGSVQTNRKLNETVGGMNLISQDANQITEYQIRLFAETWVEKVVQQIDALEVAYETDERVLAIAGNKAKEWRRQGHQHVSPEMIEGEVDVKVNVGFGATNPFQRVEKMAVGFNAVAQIAPNALADVNQEEVIKEVFGVLGYQDGARFFHSLSGDTDPQVSQLQAQIQQLTAIIEQEQHKEMAKTQGQMQLEEVKGRIQERITQLKARADAEKQATERRTLSESDKLGALMDKYKIDQGDKASRRQEDAKMAQVDRQEQTKYTLAELQDRRAESAESITREQMERDTNTREHRHQMEREKASEAILESFRDSLAENQAQLQEIAQGLDAVRELQEAHEGQTTELQSIAAEVSALREQSQRVSEAITQAEAERQENQRLIAEHIERHGSEDAKRLARQVAG